MASCLNLPLSKHILTVLAANLKGKDLVTILKVT